MTKEMKDALKSKKYNVIELMEKYTAQEELGLAFKEALDKQWAEVCISCGGNNSSCRACGGNGLIIKPSFK